LSEHFSKQLAETLRVLVGITRFRGGPQDLPVSPRLLILMVVLSIIPDLLVSALGPATNVNLVIPLAISIVFTLGWYGGMLKLAGKPERFLQTLTAIFGVQFVLTPVLVLGGWFFATYQRDPGWQVFASFLALIIAIWVLVILVRILRAATEWSLALCIVTTFASQFVALQLMASLLPEAAAAK
jgi:hypothetical protein